jgi:hypothetical protein
VVGPRSCHHAAALTLRELRGFQVRRKRSALSSLLPAFPTAVLDGGYTTLLNCAGAAWLHSTAMYERANVHRTSLRLHKYGAHSASDRSHQMNRGRASACRGHRALLCVALMVCCCFGRHTCDATPLTAAFGQVDAQADTTAPASTTTVLATSTATSRVAAQAARATISTIVSTTTTAAFGGCGGVTRCLDHTDCAQCLEAINATSGFPHTLAQFYSLDTSAYRANDVALFRGFQSTASCSTSATPPGILNPALQELNDEVSCARDGCGHLPCHRLHVLCGPRLSAVSRCGVCRSCLQRRQQRQ